jgi:hypothetical protein
VARIAAANGIGDPTRIEVGRRLILSRAAAAAPKPDERAVSPRDSGASYRMERSDTLYSLARWSRVSLRALTAANPAIDPRKIEIGDLVRLPRGAADPQVLRARERGRAQAAPAPGPAPARHAREGDSDKPDSASHSEEENEPEGM